MIYRLTLNRRVVFVLIVAGLGNIIYLPTEVYGAFHLWDINEIYSTADGTQQFIELSTTSNGQEFLTGHTITATSDGVLKTYTWIIDSPSPTANTNILLATTSMAASSGFPTPDFIIPDNFFVPTAGTITFNFAEGFDIVIINGGLPIDGITSVNDIGTEQTASPTNYAGETSTPPFGQESLWDTFPSMPLPRADYTGNVVGSKVYLIQGFGAEINFTEYDSITENYTELAPVPYSADHSASAVHNGKIYVAGGCGFGNPCSNVTVYDIATNTWDNLPNLLLPNWSSTAQIVGDDFFVLGGNPNVNTCQKYNIPTNSWSFCEDLPTGREHSSSAVFDNKIYVINGRGGDIGDTTANEVYDPISDSWQILADKPTGMSGGWGGVFNNKIYVIGGGSPLTAANEWYDPVTDSWTSGPDMPTLRHGLVCEPVGSKIYCFGGGLFNEGGNSSLVEVFDANSFVPFPDTENPCGLLPTSGDWIITSSCSLENNFTSPANILVQDGATLTILNGFILGIDFTQFNLTVESGSGVLIQSGGAIKQQQFNLEGIFDSCSNEWQITGYFTPVESDYSGEFVTIVINDMEREFRQDFVDEVTIEGWGKTLSGDYLGIFNDLFHISTDPLDSTGNILVVGKVAIDTALIEPNSNLIIPTLPEPWNEVIFFTSDVGAGIIGKHVDVYTGEGATAILESFKITSQNNNVCQ